MIYEAIKQELKKSMLARDELRTSVLRGILAGFTNELVAQKKKPQEILSDEDALKIITRQVKQRKDSIEQFTAGDRPDLVVSEEKEMAILQAFLPELMSEDEIRSVVMQKKAELGPIDPSKAGQFIGTIMKDLKGKADGMLVKKVVEEALQ